MQNRNIIYDEVAGLLIIYMIAYHIMQWAGMQESEGMHIMAFMNFFMPWFFYKGGMFFKEKSSMAMLTGSFRRLMIPFFIWSIIGAIVFGFFSCYYFHTHTMLEYLKMNIYQLLTEGCVPGNAPLWFLVALFFVKIIFNKCAAEKIPIIYPSIIGIAISMALHFYELSLPHYVNYISSGLFFFGMGILLNEISNRYMFKVVCILVYICLSIISRPIVDIHLNTLLEGYYLLWPIWSIAGIVTINTLFEYIHKKTRVTAIPTLAFIGRKSMTFYVVHWPIIMTLFYLFR